MVHGVYERQELDGMPVPRGSVLLHALEANLLALGRTYSFISIDDLFSMMSGAAPWKKRCLVLTFDDSLKCHAEVVAPRLAGWGIPAVFYLSTETIQTGRAYWWLRLEYALSKLGKPVLVTLPDGQRRTVTSTLDVPARRSLTTALRSTGRPFEIEKVIESVEAEAGVRVEDVSRAYPYAESLTWNDARELVRLGMTVGSHTVSHPNLSLLDRDELHSEFTSSRRLIERECQMPCQHLCYPHGFYSDAVCDVARQAGYFSAVTADGPGWNGPETDPFRLGRFAMPEQPYKLPYIVSGAESVIGALKSRVAAPV